MTTKHEGLPVAGYQPQSQNNVDLVNAMKRLEETVLRSLDSLNNGTNDGRWLAVARTHIEQGFMAVNRSIFKPARVKLEGEQ